MGVPIRVLIVDDHAMLAESLARLLRDDPDIEVVGHEMTAGGGIARAVDLAVDVVVMDFHLPDMDGASATARLKEINPRVKVVTLTGSDKRGAYFAAMKAGSSAWVRKTRAMQELRAAIVNVHAGLGVVDDELAELPTLDQLRVHYQPVVDLDTEVVRGFEALVRWEHPSRGLLPPDQFLPRAAETGLLADIDSAVRREASSQLARWQTLDRHARPLWVSVNLSADDLDRPHIDDEVAAEVESAGIDPADFVLEVTETVLLKDDEETVVRLNRLKAVGVGLALDDFGTAFSSISYLRRFPFDHLKIDTSFTAGLPGSNRTTQLVEAIHHMTEAVGLLGIAEGIERTDQAQALRKAGWRLGQGFLYSRAVDASTCDRLLATAS